MKAYLLRGYGGPEQSQLSEVPDPVPGANDLLVELAATALNPVDFKIRAGSLKMISSLNFPVIEGNELSGTIIGCGSHVAKFGIGDKIVARVEKERLGAFAERVCIDASVAALAPKSVPLTDSTALPLAGLTALQALRDELQAGPGKHILITGGAGGVGTLAIQIAKHLGAEITTTASPRGEALVREMGADHVIDYTTTDLSSVTTRFDGVFDLIGTDTLRDAFKVAKSGTTVVSISGIPEPETARKDLQRGFKLRAMFWLASFGLRRAAAKCGVKYRFLFMHPSGDDLNELVEMVDTGALRLIIDKRFGFSELADAMVYLETGRAKGKVVVEAGR